MHALAVISIVLALFWTVTAVVAFRVSDERPRIAQLSMFLLLAATLVLAAVWAPLAPLSLASWFAYGLALPDGTLRGRGRLLLAGLVVAGTLGWTAILAADGSGPDTGAFLGASLGLGAVAAGAVALRSRRATDEQRRMLQWLIAAAVLVTGFAVLCATLHVMIDSPQVLPPWLAGSLLLISAGQLAALLVPGARAAATALIESVAVTGVAGLVAVVYLVVVAGINGAPRGHERGVLLASLVAAVVVAVLALPVRTRLVGFGNALVGGRLPSTEEVVTTFGARMSRAVPMDELMLQLVESLRATSASGGAEIWTGTQGRYTRAVSLPERGPGRLELDARERVVIGQARIGGPGWASVWLPQLLIGTAGDIRVVPVAHLGELLGLIVLHRNTQTAQFSEADERPVVELARQLGLALHNVRLDSALQASLAEVAERNEQLQASRLRIVTASDASRRMIERNLHDGAQQHLVALAVKIGLARAVAEDGDTETVLALLADLRGDVQTTITELRELAHGIYPPLLRDRGLGEALRTAAIRSPLPCTVDVELPGRFPEEVETAAYFCCLEAMQNAGKYAGADAKLRVTVHNDAASLILELIDDGVGFPVSSTPLGHGFVNMQDRLGAIGGTLIVDSAPGSGTKVRASIPAQPRAVQYG